MHYYRQNPSGGAQFASPFGIPYVPRYLEELRAFSARSRPSQPAGSRIAQIVKLQAVHGIVAHQLPGDLHPQLAVAGIAGA